MSEFDDLRPAAISALAGSSFDPDSAGNRLIQAEEERLAALIKQIKAAFNPNTPGRVSLDEAIKTFVAGYRRRLVGYISAESRCMSSVVTGPSKFPVQQQQKRHVTAHKRRAELLDYQEYGVKAAIKSLKPEKTADGELAGLKEEAGRLAVYIDFMKKINADIKGYRLTLKEALERGKKELGPEEYKDCEWRLCHGTFNGFASFELRNKTTKLKRLKDRIAQLDRQEALRQASNGPETIGTFAGGRVVRDREANRVQIFHDTRPTQQVINSLAGRGFHWSRRLGCWQRILTNSAEHDALALTGATDESPAA